MTKIKKNGDQGIEFIHPDNPMAKIRVMPGNPNSPHVNSQTPYVKVENSGKKFNKNGGQVKVGNEADVHISFDDFKFGKFKDVFK